MPDLYGAGLGGLSMEDALGYLPSMMPRGPTYQEVADQYRAQQFPVLPKLQDQQPAAPAAVSPPATEFISWPQYRAAYPNVDPAVAYKDYVTKVAPDQLSRMGYTQDQIPNEIATFVKANPPPPSAPPAQDQGVLANAGNTLLAAYRQMGVTAKAGVAVTPGLQNPEMLRQAALEAQQAEQLKPEPLQRFQKETSAETGSLWGYLSNVGKATVKNPEGAFDAFLGTVAGFVPYMAAGAGGGLAGSAVPVVGSVAGAAVAMGLTAADLEAGGKAIEHLQQAAIRDGIDLKDGPAVKKWFETKGAKEVFGPAVAAGLTSGAITVATMGITGALGARATNAVRELATITDMAAANTLRQTARQAAVASGVGNVVGFGGASVAADVAAGDATDERDMLVNALTLAIPSYFHARGVFKATRPGEAAKPAVVSATETAKPRVEPTQEELAAQLKGKFEAAQEPPPPPPPGGPLVEMGGAEQRAAYERTVTERNLDTAAGVKEALDAPTLKAQLDAEIAAVAGARDQPAKIDALERLAQAGDNKGGKYGARVAERAQALADELKAVTDEMPEVRTLDEAIASNPDKVEEVATATQVARDLMKEVVDETVAQVKAEAQGRKAERTPAATTAEAGTAPVVGFTTTGTAGGIIQPTVPAAAKLPTVERGAAAPKRKRGLKQNAPVVEGAGDLGKEPLGTAAGAGVTEEKLHAGTAVEPERGQPAGGAGGNVEPTAKGPVVPGRNERGARAVDTGSELVNKLLAANQKLAQLRGSGVGERSKAVRGLKKQVDELEKQLEAAPLRQKGSALTKEEADRLANTTTVKATPENNPGDILNLMKQAARELSEQEEDQGKPDTGGAIEETIKSKPGANVFRLTKILGPSLYGDPTKMAEISVKELFQNAFDGIKPLLQSGKVKTGKIDIQVNDADRTIMLTDNGSGMEPNILGTKFLEIAGTRKEGERSSGGLGIAKMQFLFGNDNIEVVTLRDGKLSTLRSSGPELEASMADPKAAPNIDVQSGVKQTADFPEGHGTRITITVPRTWTDPVSGETKEIEFSTEKTRYEVLNKSPLLEPVEVTFNGKKVYNVGTEFPHNDYTQFVNVHFPWGSAHVYVSTTPSQGWGNNVHVLSNGLWQFSFKLAKNPADSWSDPLPYKFYVNVDSKAKPEDPGYPFALNRQSFSAMTAKGFDNIFKYIGALYRGLDIANDVSNFGSIHYLTPNDSGGIDVSKPHELKPTKPMSDNSLTAVSKGDTIEVVDGKLVVKGRHIPELTPEQLKGNVVNLDEFKVDQSTINPREVMVHDNLNVRQTAELDALKMQRDAARQKWRDLSNDPHANSLEEMKAYDAYQKLDAKLNEETAKPLPPARSLVEVAREKFGSRFDEFVQGVGAEFIALRDLVARVMNYPDLRKEAIGISFDKEYRGVSIRIPFSGSFLNIAVPEKTDPGRAGLAYFGTMIHELAHHKIRDHNERFPAEMQRIIYEVEAAAPQRLRDIKEVLVHLATVHNDILQFLNKETESEHSEPRGKRFKDGSNQARDERPTANVAPAGEGREPGEGLPSRAAERIEPARAESRRAGPVAETGNALKQAVRDQHQTDQAQEQATQQTPHEAIIGLNEAGNRTHIAYKRGENDYTLYPVTKEIPKGDPAGKQSGLTREQVYAAMRDDGSEPLHATGGFDREPGNDRDMITRWKAGPDGEAKLVYAATRDQTGDKWTVLTGNDLQKDAEPYTSTKVADRAAAVAESHKHSDFASKLQAENVFQAERTRDLLAAKGGGPIQVTMPSGLQIKTAEAGSPIRYVARTVEAAFKALDMALPKEWNLNVQYLLRNSDMVKRGEEMVAREGQPLRQRAMAMMDKYKMAPKELGDFMGAITVEHRNPLLRAKYSPEARYINPDQPLLGKSEFYRKNKMGQLNATKQLDAYEQAHPGFRDELRAFMVEAKKFSDGTVDLMRDSGRISATTAADIKNAYQIYAPLGTKKSRLGKATGQSAFAEDPIEKMFAARFAAIADDIDNRTKTILGHYARIADLRGDDGQRLFKVLPIEAKHLVHNVDSGVVDVSTALDTKNSFVFYEGGVPTRVEVTEPKLLKAIESYKGAERDTAIQAMLGYAGFYTRMFSALHTSLSVPFAFRNFIRDYATNLTQLDPRINYGAFNRAMFSGDVVGAAFRLGFHNAMKLLGKDSLAGSTFAQMADRDGAMIDHRSRYGADQIATDIRTSLAPTWSKRGLLNKAEEYLAPSAGKLTNFISGMTHTLEAWNRLAVYKAAMESGIDHKEAATLAKMATTNFELRGTWMPYVSPFYAFANAKMQGARTMAENLGFSRVAGAERGGLKQGALGLLPFAPKAASANLRTVKAAQMMLAIGLLSGYANYKTSAKDKDGRTTYGKMNEYQLDEYLHIPGTGLSIPIPQEIGSFFLTGNTMADQLWGDRAGSASTPAMRFITGMIQNFWPGGTSMHDPVGARGEGLDYLGRLATPTPYIPFYDIAANTTSFGQPVNRLKGSTTVPPEFQGAKYASPAANFLARHTPGLQAAPPDWDHIFQGLFGQQGITEKSIITNGPVGGLLQSTFRSFQQKPFAGTTKQDYDQVAIDVAHGAYRAKGGPLKTGQGDALKRMFDVTNSELKSLQTQVSKTTNEDLANRLRAREDELRSRTLKRYYEATGVITP